MKREYSNDYITVYWDSEKCTHVRYCWLNLPEVFKPRERPWVKINGADPLEIKKVVECCPSGALTCKLKKAAS